MRLLINTLSVGHLSGRHVVYGFVGQLARWTAGQHQLVLLHYAASPPPAEIAGPHVERLAISDRLQNWSVRAAWESWELPRVVRREGIDVAFTASGAVVPGLKTPQVSLAQNPWCLVPQVQRSVVERIKASVQRRAYRTALQRAAMMFFISDHLRDLYRRHANGRPETRTDIAWVGLDDATHAAAQAMRGNVAKQPLVILCVSAMARWKGIETLVEALRILRSRGCDALLRLVGPWPDSVYEDQIRRQIHESKLDSAVTIAGHVGRDQLHRHYAEAKVYCLMSCCESFGIPAAEAMAFGTPVVSAQASAVSEICHGAGLFGPTSDPAWTADALEQLLTEDQTWEQHSQQAVRNAARLRWEECSRPLMKMFDISS